MLLPLLVSSYVGNSYFCDTGAHTYVSSGTVYMDDPWWDGEGCGGSSICLLYAQLCQVRKATK